MLCIVDGSKKQKHSHLSESSDEGAIILEIAGHPPERLVLLALLGVEVSDEISLLLVQRAQLLQALVLDDGVLRLLLKVR